MLFVPLPLFATLLLVAVLIRMITARDMSQVSNQLFGGLVGLYALQSFLLVLRWGYDLRGVAIWIGLLAPVLPFVAYAAYLSLMDRLVWSRLWPGCFVLVNWVVLLVWPDIADGLILLTFLGFGAALVFQAVRNRDELALVRIDQTVDAVFAMMLTGAVLIASACVDLFVIVDFIRTGGQNVGLTLTLVQTGFLLCIGIAATWGQSGAVEELPAVQASDTQEADAPLIARLVALFQDEELHLDMELNLRRMARRLGVPDRSLSQAVNRNRGMSVSQFVNTFRVKDACVLLAQTDQTILQVSLAAGFMTKSNFNREFSRITGQTPSQWRVAHKKA